MVSYEEYITAYHGGAISADEWAGLEARAADQLRLYQRRYTVTAPDSTAAIMAVCAMAEALHNIDVVANGDAVQSVAVGSVSVGYGSAVASAVDVSERGQAKALYRAASLYLDIYRGCG